MIRETFVRTMNELHEAWNANKNYYDKLSNMCIVIDDPPAFQFLDVALSALSEEIGDTYGYVQYFVFDMDWGETKAVYDPFADKIITIDDADKLYDYIQMRRSNDETR